MSGKISLALGGPKKVNGKLAPIKGVKRSHAALHEDDDNDLDHAKAQAVSHFDKSAGGAIDEQRKPTEKGPLVIAPQANRDWRDASKRKRQRNGLPAEARSGGQSVEDAAAREKELETLKPGFGLNVSKRENSSEEATTNDRDAPGEAAPTHSQPTERDVEAPLPPKTDDDLALAALLGTTTTKSTLVLPAVSEEAAYNQDMTSAPSGPTLDDYTRVPVEDFGAGLLRGMGWIEGQGIGSQKGRRLEKTKVPARRPALLGIGAKEEAAVAQEMGTWGKAAKKGGEVKVYNPVLLRDKRTGEMFTEEEAKERREREKRRGYEEEFERREREGGKMGRRRDEDEDEEEGGKGRRRHKESREEDGKYRSRPRDDYDSRERDREKEGDRDRERRRRDDSEEEYQRRKKDKERRRRERDRDRDDDRSRDRSRRHDGDRDRDRDRDRQSRRHREDRG